MSTHFLFEVKAAADRAGFRLKAADSRCVCVFLQHASSDVEKMVLGNKCDMNDKRQVSKERGEKVGSRVLTQKTSCSHERVCSRWNTRRTGNHVWTVSVFMKPNVLIRHVWCDELFSSCSARHRLRHQVSGNQRQVQHQCGGGEFWSRLRIKAAASRVLPAPNTCSAPQAFYTLARDVMTRLNRKMVREINSAGGGGTACFYLQLWRLVFLFLLFLVQNDSAPSGAGGPVKITESRSKKSFFRCALL